MHWIDWVIVVVPLLVVLMIGLRAQKYVRDVSDFLAAGRVAGRYVLCVAVGAAGMGLISLVGNFEMYYKAGFAVGFWGGITAPLGMIILLTGFCFYRYRETRALTMGQFFEIRYSKSFRILAAILMSLSGIINYAIFPAVGARALIYFCDLPLYVNLLGMQFPTFGLVMAGFLSLAVFIVCLGGQITIMTTDAVQGVLSYPLYLIIAAYLLYKFSWSNEMAPALLDRPPGKSMLNPYDVYNLRDFNLFYVFVGVFGYILNMMSWQGAAGYNAAAKSPHEQKLGSVLGSWRSGFAGLMYVFLGIAAYTFLNHANFATQGADVRRQLATKAVNDIAVEDRFGDLSTDAFSAYRQSATHYLGTGEKTPEFQALLDKATADQEMEDARIAELQEEQYRLDPASRPEPVEEEETPGPVEPERPDPEAHFATVQNALRGVVSSEQDNGEIQDIGKKKAETLGAIYRQMRVPTALKNILPVGIMGSLCALMIFLLITTDTTYMHSWGSIVVQDLVLPFRKKPFTPRQQLNLLRLVIAGVAVFAFFFSFLYQQDQYVLMFFAITGAIWLGGAGPVILFGLYWKRGTTAAAFAALISGSALSVGAIFLQNNWVDTVYPWLLESGHITWVRRFLEGVSKPLNPIIEWKVTGESFPINGQEVWCLTMLISVGLYAGLSLLSRKEPFNMQRMLHRGKYRVEGKAIDKPKWAFGRILGIDEQYTKGDKALAWSVFLWNMVWGFGLAFLGVIIWNRISPWPDEWWAEWFFITNVIIGAVIGIVSTIWFTIGTTWDLRNMFRRLAAKEANVRDDGRVAGHVSIADIELVEKVEHRNITDAEEDYKDLE